MFTPYVAVPAEGRRLALTTCRRCGAAVILDEDPALDGATIHLAWHAAVQEDDHAE